MIIVDERNYIVKELEDKGFGVFGFFEQHQLLSVDGLCQLPLQKRAEFLLVDTQTLLDRPELQESFKVALNTFLGVVFFHEQQNEKAQRWVEENAAFLTKIVGEYALPMPQIQWTMLSNQLQFLWTILQEQKDLQVKLSRFSQELDQLTRTAEAEMSRARRIHEGFVPKRSEEIKGVEFLSRYAAGDGGGGEFYDLIKTPQKVFHVIVSSESYLISSALMGLLHKHRQAQFVPTDFLNEAAADITSINSSKKKKAQVSVTVLELELSQLVLSVHGSREVECYSLQRGKIPTSQTYQLERNEKIVVFSPGFLFNWKEVHGKKDPIEFVATQNMSLAELLPELFYQIRSDQESDFLKKDAAVVMMEVKRHGMHQV